MRSPALVRQGVNRYELNPRMTFSHPHSGAQEPRPVENAEHAVNNLVGEDWNTFTPSSTSGRQDGVWMDRQVFGPSAEPKEVPKVFVRRLGDELMSTGQGIWPRAPSTAERGQTSDRDLRLRIRRHDRVTCQGKESIIVLGGWTLIAVVRDVEPEVRVILFVPNLPTVESISVASSDGSRKRRKQRVPSSSRPVNDWPVRIRTWHPGYGRRNGPRWRIAHYSVHREMAACGFLDNAV